jgi:thiol-disulfide isomerase/thioredoxin
MKARALLAAAALAALAAPGRAQDMPPEKTAPAPEAPAEKPAASDPVHKAWEALGAARSALQAAGRDPEKRKAAGPAYTAASKAFAEAFAVSDWKAIDPAKEKELLEAGLRMAGGKALEAKDAAGAVKAFEFYVAALPGEPNTAPVEFYNLATAYLMAGKSEKAIALWEKHAKGDNAALSSAAKVSLGDWRCASGDLEGARKIWKDLVDAAPTDKKPDPTASARSGAEMRLALVGNLAPEVDSKTWLGAEASPLSKLKGQVVVLDFWATWCPPCRGVMPDLNRYYGERKKDGLTVLGITRYYKNGFMPVKGTKDPVSDGESLKEISEADFPAHLAKFKENLAIDYPFVTAAEADFNAYKIRGIPTLFVVDREGKVAFAKVGGGDETLLKMAVERCLKPAK